MKNPSEHLEPDPVLARAFPNPAMPDDKLHARAIDRELTDQLHVSGGSSMETLETQIRQRRELFGSDYIHEYGGPAVRQVLRDSAREHAKDIEQRLRAKQSRRLP